MIYAPDNKWLPASIKINYSRVDECWVVVFILASIAYQMMGWGKL